MASKTKPTKKKTNKKRGRSVDFASRSDFDMMRQFLLENRKFLDAHVINYTENQKTLLEIWSDMQTKQELAKQDINNIGVAINKHVAEEENRWNGFESSISQLSSHIGDLHGKIDNVTTAINTVQANGNPGLGNSIRDLYDGLKELKQITKELKIKRDFKTSFIRWKETKPFIKFGTTKTGFIIYAIILLFILNAILHPIGFGFDAMGIVKGFGKWLSGM